MTTYTIISTAGIHLGTYTAADKAGALDALARDAGYADYAEAQASAPSSDDLVVEEETTMTKYEAYRVAADGRAGERVPGGDSDGDVIETGAIEECRAAIAERLGADKMPLLRWSGLGDDVEAYYDSEDEGCGGYHIRIA